MENIKLKVNKLLQERNWTIATLATKIGTSRQNLGNRLNSKDLHVGLLIKMAQAFDVPVAFFFEESSTLSGKCPNCDNLRRELDLAYKYIEKMEGRCEKKVC